MVSEDVGDDGTRKYLVVVVVELASSSSLA